MLSVLLAIYRGARAARSNADLARHAREQRAARLRNMDYTELHSERVNILSLQMMFDRLPHQSPAEQVGREMLANRLDEVQAAIDARAGADA